MPVLSKSSDNLWCAWDSLGYDTNGKGLYVREISDDNKTGTLYTITEGLTNICSPCFAFYKNQKETITWSQTNDGKNWSLWKSEYDFDNKNWSKPVLVTDENNPRFGSCIYDSLGQLWIAFSIQTTKGRDITVKKID